MDISGPASRLGDWLQTGDLITGIINVKHERAYMVPAIRNPERAQEKAQVVYIRLPPADHLAC